ncbi:hypothetical protein GA0111570_106117 [Raineyella antarctica]|uniref:Uncharacterized protein n=1 Tax=Raineyella antarctica TaxID=1577474 RepID=A0A1G6H3L3_9ACTN|nr:hypothetical protein [Raineyella antarctica]SDB88718.1 hypothetical protein GA0111570_106117 [Raineyella antarctica]
MKRLLFTVLWGLAVYVAVMLAEFAVTLPFPMGEDTTPDLTVEFGLTAPLAFLITWVLARLLHTTRKDGTLRGVVWAAVALVLYVVVGLGNGTLGLFMVWTFPLLILAILLGPIIAGQVAGRTRTPHLPRTGHHTPA